MSDRWHHHFIAQALLTARMSKDPRTQVGAVIIGPDREIRSVGFNGQPRGMNDTSERLNDQAYCDKWIVHAERNAICNAARAGISLKGCTLYLAATDETGNVWGGAPCTNCAAELINAGVVATISYPFKNTTSRWAANVAEAKIGLEECGVWHTEIQPLSNSVHIHIDAVDIERVKELFGRDDVPLETARLVPRYSLYDCMCNAKSKELGVHHNKSCSNYVPF